MTTLDKIKAEIQKVLDVEGDSENAKAQALALLWVLELFDKYAEQEPTDEWQDGYDMAWEEAEVFYEVEEREDAVSRADMWKVVHQCEENNSPSWVWREMLSQLPSVQPKPKTGHWDKSCRCSECKEWSILESEKLSGKYKFCPNCGCRMVKPRESEDKG